ncbi:MAG: 1-acyl-sn-glycerol-3-phosphate acyltransferase [Clostridia bacterium]|nr:1-acyl-sn-glycerol-3-phosphate acyltransferase [Clostridia bacterium]
MIKQTRTRWFFKGLFNVLFHIIYRFDVKGLENIPEEGKAILCPNHIHLVDSIALVIHLKRMIYIMVKKELMSNKIGIWFWNKIGCFPVDRGKADVHALEVANNHLNDGDLLLIFPEGTRNALEKGKKMKKGAAMIAVQSKSPIIPVGMQGTFKPFSKIKIRFGKPIDLSEYFTKEELNPRDYIQITNKMQDEIIKLRDGE